MEDELLKKMRIKAKLELNMIKHEKKKLNTTLKNNIINTIIKKNIFCSNIIQSI